MILACRLKAPSNPLSCTPPAAHPWKPRPHVWQRSAARLPCRITKLPHSQRGGHRRRIRHHERIVCPVPKVTRNVQHVRLDLPAPHSIEGAVLSGGSAVLFFLQGLRDRVCTALEAASLRVPLDWVLGACVLVVPCVDVVGVGMAAYVQRGVFLISRGASSKVLFATAVAMLVWWR